MWAVEGEGSKIAETNDREQDVRRKTVAAGCGVMLILGLCVAAALFLDGFYLPGKRCRPVGYPDGKRTAKAFQSVTEADLADVLAFYDDALNVQPRPGDTGRWTRQELAPDAFWYTCYGSDINRLSTETGCVTVRRQGQGTVSIEGLLLRSEGSNVQCPIK